MMYYDDYLEFNTPMEIMTPEEEMEDYMMEYCPFPTDEELNQLYIKLYGEDY